MNKRQSKMVVSVITVCLNSESTIEDTFKSVLHQSYDDIEYLVIDGGSNDGTVDIIKKYELLFEGKMNWISEDDDGLYNAMNKGIQKSTGDVIGMLNSDDMYHSDDVLEMVVKKFNQTNPDAVYGDLYYVNREDTRVIRNWKSGPFNPARFKNGWMPPHPTFYVKKGLFDRYGLLDEELDVSADYEIMLRFLYKYQIPASYISEVLVRMRMGGNSNKSWKHRIRAMKQDYISWKKNDLDSKVYTQVLKRLRKLPQYITGLFESWPG